MFWSNLTTVRIWIGNFFLAETVIYIQALTLICFKKNRMIFFPNVPLPLTVNGGIYFSIEKLFSTPSVACVWAFIIHFWMIRRWIFSNLHQFFNISKSFRRFFPRMHCFEVKIMRILVQKEFDNFIRILLHHKVNVFQYNTHFE